MRRFIYLDTETLNSYIAQIYDGLVQSKNTEKQNINSTTSQNEEEIDANGAISLKIFGKGVNGELNALYRHLKETNNQDLAKDVETKILHDNAFDHLMNYLEKNEMINNYNIGDFVLVEDYFYILDIEYYQSLFNNKDIMSIAKKSEEEQKIKTLKILKEAELSEPDADSKEIKNKYRVKIHEVKSSLEQSFSDIKKIIDILVSIIPYKRTLCIADNLVVLNDKFMRDSSDMTAFKYGGKIKVLGYITNRIGDITQTTALPQFAQLGSNLDEIMLSFFDSVDELNVIHPIAIYYE